MKAVAKTKKYKLVMRSLIAYFKNKSIKGALTKINLFGDEKAKVRC